MSNMLRSINRVNFARNYLGLKCARMESSGTKPEPIDKSAVSYPGTRVIPSALDKRLLVYFKKYKSIEEIPHDINTDTISRIRSKLRIRIANCMIVVTILACIFASWWGKQRTHRGENLTKILEEKYQKVLSDSKKDH